MLFWSTNFSYCAFSFSTSLNLIHYSIKLWSQLLCFHFQSIWLWCLSETVTMSWWFWNFSVVCFLKASQLWKFMKLLLWQVLYIEHFIEFVTLYILETHDVLTHSLFHSKCKHCCYMFLCEQDVLQLWHDLTWAEHNSWLVFWVLL